MTARPWTYPELDRLRQLRMEGLTRRAIAKQLNRSYGSILAQCHLHGIGRPVKQPSSIVEMMAVPKEEVVTLYELGWRFEQFSSEGLCVMRKERKL